MKVQAGVPQGSIDGPLLFNLFITDLVLFLSETSLSNYTDDNNLYSIGKELDIVKENLRKDFNVVTDWFFENYMSLNPRKCRYICLGKNKENDTFNLENISLKNTKEEVILVFRLLITSSLLIIVLDKEQVIKNIKLFRLKTKRNFF